MKRQFNNVLISGAPYQNQWNHCQIGPI